ncbi:caspase family protein, partial [bacterium]|nr:caspase family protein [bacterium]
MRRFLIIVLICIFSTSVLAQQSRGVSQAGRITNNRKPVETPVVKKETESSAVLTASVRFSEPSGDQVLSQGETGHLTVEVKNNSPSVTVEPQLEFIITTSWNSNSQTIQKTMASIAPGETGTFKGQIPWSEQLPSGTITYQVKAVDRLTGAISSLSQVYIQNEQVKAPTEEIAVVDVDAAVPRVAVSNPDAIAVVIGNKSYPHPDVPDVDYALLDASIVKKYLVNMLGCREGNIIYIENASKADFELVFGTNEEPQGKLYDWVKQNRSDVFVYYSGHGAPDVVTKKAYFMPSNSDPNYVRIGGYPLDLFYTNLSKISAKSITVVIDACFSGASQSGMLIQDASPMFVDVDLPLATFSYSLLTSSAGNEISSWYPEAKHSLFTYYLLRAIRGEADVNKDRKVTLKEIGDYIGDQVPYMARRLYGREQTPIVKGQFNSV